MTGRFADRDLISILDYQVTHEHADPVRRSENHTLQPGTAAWSTFARHQRRPAQPLLTMKAMTPDEHPFAHCYQR